jgi:formamidopyrimidine-DNA glycosylase
MPELPEVETIVQAMKFGGRGGRPLLDLTVDQVHLLWPRTLAEPGDPAALQRLAGQKILDISRRGKFIQLKLSEDYLLIHLRMSGDIRVADRHGYNPVIDSVKKHDRFVIYFKESVAMFFNDTRKFGRIWLVKSAEQVTVKLGPEPFDPEIEEGLFYQKLQTSRRQIKPLLMDQTFLAGLGNIYTDEALHQAGIHPRQSSHNLTPEQAGYLLAAIRNVLSEGIQRNGASIDWIYRGGDFQNYFKVYQRMGKSCFNCGQVIQKILVGQRGTHFCPGCQPEPAPYHIHLSERRNL